MATTDAVAGVNPEKDASTTGTAPNGSQPIHRYDYGGNPLYAVHTNTEGRLPAFGGEFQPGLYKPIAHRKFANPAPLGLSAFALTTFVLSLINLQTRGVTQPNIVASLALGYGGLVQLLAGMWEMAVGNTFGATALSSYGGFWISYAIILNPTWNILGTYETAGKAGGDPLVVQSALGFFLTAFLFLAVAAFVEDNGHASISTGLNKAGGVFGLLAAFLAWYNAFAGIADSSNSFFIIPVFHFPWSEKGYEARKKTQSEKDKV